MNNKIQSQDAVGEVVENPLATQSAKQGAQELPPILFDGHAVYNEITRHLGKSHCFSPQAVATTLDAVVRLMRKEGAMQEAPEQADVRDEATSVAGEIECWSRDEEDFNALSLSDLLDRHDDLKAGDTVWVGEAAYPDPKRLISADSIIEHLGEQAYDIGGEYAEDYPDVSDEQAKELESLVADWIKRTCPPTFYEVKNIKPYVLSHDDFPGDMKSKRAASTDGEGADHE